MQLLCTRMLSPACHCARLSTIRSQTHPTLLTPVETRSRCACTHTNPTSHILICSRHCLRPLRIRPQHRSKFQTPSPVPAQSNPDLQSDRPVRCEVLFVRQLIVIIGLKIVISHQKFKCQGLTLLFLLDCVLSPIYPQGVAPSRSPIDVQLKPSSLIPLCRYGQSMSRDRLNMWSMT